MSNRPGFTIYPAIDMRHGKVVRLMQGDPERQTVYGDDPGQTARRWIEAGARWLHVVNLDGAFGDGGAENLAALNDILLAASTADPAVAIQWGGGVRTMEDVRQLIQSGVNRVILGSAAVEKPDVIIQALEQFGARSSCPGHRCAGRKTVCAGLAASRRRRSSQYRTKIFPAWAAHVYLY